MTKFITLFSAAVVLLLTGCAPGQLLSSTRVQTDEDRERELRLQGVREAQLGLPTERQKQFIMSNYHAVDRLLKNISDPELNSYQPLIVCTVVDIDNLNKSSTIGRLISAQLISRLQQQGYTDVMQLEARESVTPSADGMTLLSRDAQKIARSYNAQAVVVGTFGTTKDGSFVHLEILDGNRVLSATDYALPRL
jgi:hypothetical protein